MAGLIILIGVLSVLTPAVFLVMNGAYTESEMIEIMLRDLRRLEFFRFLIYSGLSLIFLGLAIWATG